LHNLIQITEAKILEAIDIATEMDGVPPQSLLLALEKGKVFVEAELTPFYAFDPTNGSIFITSEEAMDGNFDA